MYNKVNEVTPLPIKFIRIVLMGLILSLCAMSVCAHTIDRFSELNDPSLLLGPYIWFRLCAVLCFAWVFVPIVAVLPTLITKLPSVIQRIRPQTRPGDVSEQNATQKNDLEGAQIKQTINDSSTSLCDGTKPVLDEAKFSALFRGGWAQYPHFLQKVKEEYPKFVKRDFGKLAFEITESDFRPINDRFLDASNQIIFKAFNDAFHDAFGITPSSQRPSYYKDCRIGIGYKFKDFLQK